MPMLECISVDSGNAPQHSIIWLHVLGAEVSDFLPLAEQLNLPVAVRYIFPHAPQQPVTVNGGYVMRAWYDILSADIGAKQDESGVHASQCAIEKLIQQERQRGIPAQNIFLAGFSQGGAVVLHTGLRHAEKLGGILALSTYLPLAKSLATEITTHAHTTPILMAHGTQDSVVPFALGKASCQILEQCGCQVEWYEYPMPHSVCAAEIADIENWLARQLQT